MFCLKIFFPFLFPNLPPNYPIHNYPTYTRQYSVYTPEQLKNNCIITDFTNYIDQSTHNILLDNV